MNRNSSHSNPPPNQDTRRDSRVVGHHEVADDYADDYDARGGQFFGTPGDYGRRHGWKDGHPVGREEAMRGPATGWNYETHGHRHPGVFGGTGPFDSQWGDADDTGTDGNHDPDYQQWRQRQLRQFDEDYHAYRGERFKKFSDEFNAWRKARAAGGEKPEDGADRRSK